MKRAGAGVIMCMVITAVRGSAPVNGQIDIAAHVSNPGAATVAMWDGAPVTETTPLRLVDRKITDYAIIDFGLGIAGNVYFWKGVGGMLIADYRFASGQGYSPTGPGDLMNFTFNIFEIGAGPCYLGKLARTVFYNADVTFLLLGENVSEEAAFRSYQTSWGTAKFKIRADGGMRIDLGRFAFKPGLRYTHVNAENDLSMVVGFEGKLAEEGIVSVGGSFRYSMTMGCIEGSLGVILRVP